MTFSSVSIFPCSFLFNSFATTWFILSLRRWHWIHPYLKSVHCPSSAIKSPSNSNHVINHFFVPRVLLLQTSDFATERSFKRGEKKSALLFLTPSQMPNLYLELSLFIVLFDVDRLATTFSPKVFCRAVAQNGVRPPRPF